MVCNSLAVITDTDVFLFGFTLLLVFLLILISFFVATWVRRNAVSVCPYTGLPLRRGSELPYEGARKILQFVYDRQEYDNRIFDIKRAAICRETGRVFPNCVTWLDRIDVDWTFLKKRYPGNYVSWGSLTLEQQSAIRKLHDSLESFQTEISCPDPSPREATPKYALTKPGPLYVDIDTKTLLGWQLVPDSDFEVLIVQKPKKKF